MAGLPEPTVPPPLAPLENDKTLFSSWPMPPASKWSVTTESDPNHKSYVRHVESSESARSTDAVTREYGKDVHHVKSLSQLSSMLSGSSSLSGSTHHPHSSEDYLDKSDYTGGQRTNSLVYSTTSKTSSASDSEPGSNNTNNETSQSSSMSSVNKESREISPIKSPTNSNQPTQNTASASRYQHYRRPKVTESPRLVYLCEKFINEGNVTGLAMIARRRGLPPNQRQYAWPLLLASHPYVTDPSVESSTGAESMSQLLGTGAWTADEDGMQIPLKRIKKEMQRCQKKHLGTTGSRYQPYTSGSFSTSPDDDSSTPRYSSEEHERYRRDLVVALEAQRETAILEAITSFLAKWGHTIPYESGLVYLAYSLADWVDPVCRLEDIASLLQDEDVVATFNDVVKGPVLDSPNSTDSTAFRLRSLAFKLPYSFSTVFEHLMLIVNHVPAPSMITASTTTTNRISYFLSVFRQLQPDLASHFDEEDVLFTSTSIGAGDEWLIWWIKWLGAKTWNRMDRARVWDVYFGWRPPVQDLTMAKPQQYQQRSFTQADHSRPHLSLPLEPHRPESLSATTSCLSIKTSIPSLDIDDLELDLGPDPFWSPNITDDEETTNNNNCIRIPTSPLIDHVFLCQALLKAKSATLLELDQSEIRVSLSTMGRCKDIETVIAEAGECWRTWRHSEDTENQM